MRPFEAKSCGKFSLQPSLDDNTLVLSLLEPYNAESGGRGVVALPGVFGVVGLVAMPPMLARLFLRFLSGLLGRRSSLPILLAFLGGGSEKTL